MKWLFSFCFVFLCGVTWAQQPDYLLKENSVWTFGDAAIGTLHSTGLNFNTGSPPSAIVTSTGGFGEAQASVCNANGRLLFYTEGTYVFDRNNNRMPHGDSLVGDPVCLANNLDETSSTAQGAVIVPVIGNHNQYYIFSLTEYGFDSTNQSSPHVSHGHGSELYYSVVDTTLNNGLGDVIAAQRGIFLDSNLNESMVAVSGIHCDIWILVHSNDGAIIKAYNVNANGVNTVPVVSSCGTAFLSYADAGAMKISPDRSKLFVCVDNELAGGADICDFDPSTGIVSNAVPAATYGEVYQACFSPDGSEIYFQTGFQNSLMQYNPVTKVLTEISDNVYYSDIQLGIDSKIYFQYDGTHIGCIASPNLAGTACNMISHAVHIPAGTNMYIGLHNLYVKPLVDTIGFSHDTGLCAQAGSLILQAPAGYDNYIWSTGSKDTSITVQATNFYIAQSNGLCETRFDTFKVQNINPAFTLGPDTTYCSLNPVTLQISVPNASYLWQDGSTNSTYTVMQSGIYSAQVNELGCVYSDTVNIGFINVQQDLGDDTTICGNAQSIQLLLAANAPAGASVIWSTGSTATTIVASAGTYWVYVTDSICVGADTININALNVNVRQDLGPDTTICNGQQIKLSANAPEGAAVTWSTGSTDTSVIVDTGTYWVHVTDDVCQGFDTIIVRSQKCYCVPSIPNAFTPNGDGKNDVFRTLFFDECPISSYSMYIYDRWGQVVFNTSDIKQGWDGTFNGVPADVGTYMYTMQYAIGTEAPQMQHQKGDVTLVR